MMDPDIGLLQPRPRRHSFARRLWFAAVAATAPALAIASCSGGSTGATAANAGGTASDVLTIAQASSPNSLNPAQVEQSFEWYVNLAYDPLIFWGSDGNPQPGLAASWGYAGSGNRVFDLTLRPHVKFSDGTPLTAQAVKESLEYQATANGQATPYLAGKQFTVTGPLSLRITSATPDPLIPRELSQDYLAGNIISPAALKNPARLGTTTDGAGPYILEPSATVPGDEYTYTANPNYWDKAAVHYRTVTIKVIPNQNSALDALKTGQVNVVNGDYTTAGSAASAGLQVKYAPAVFVGISLLDRSGKVAPPLSKLAVRQALNYAIDRQTVTNALFGKYGTPTNQTVCPGQDGYLSGQQYPYDPSKARELLAAAGYPHGFTLPAVTTTYFGISNVDQAIASYLGAVGVHLDLAIKPTLNTYVQGMIAATYPAAGIGYGCQPLYLEGPGLFLPSAMAFNPFKSSDPQLQSLYAEAAAASPSERANIDRRMEQRMVQLAWFVPVSLSPVFYFASPSVSGIDPSAGQPISDPVWWRSGGA